MIGRQFAVDLLVGLAELQGFVASVVLGQLLFDDVRFDGHAEVVCLSGQVRGNMVVHAPVLGLVECGVPQITPQNSRHSELVGLVKGRGDFLDLPLGLLGAKINGSAYRDGAHLESLSDVAEEYLIVGVGIRQKFVVIEFCARGTVSTQRF